MGWGGKRYPTLQAAAGGGDSRPPFTHGPLLPPHPCRYEYLAERGIDDSLAAGIAEYASSKEQARRAPQRGGRCRNMPGITHPPPPPTARIRALAREHARLRAEEVVLPPYCSRVRAPASRDCRRGLGPDRHNALAGVFTRGVRMPPAAASPDRDSGSACPSTDLPVSCAGRPSKRLAAGCKLVLRESGLLLAPMRFIRPLNRQSSRIRIRIRSSSALRESTAATMSNLATCRCQIRRLIDAA